MDTRDGAVHAVGGAARSRTGRALAGRQQGVLGRTDHALGGVPVGSLQAVGSGRGHARARVGQVRVRVLRAPQAGFGACGPVRALEAAGLAWIARRRVEAHGEAGRANGALFGVLLGRLRAVGDGGGHARAGACELCRFPGRVRVQALHAPHAVAVRGVARPRRARTHVPVLALHAPGLAMPTGAVRMQKVALGSGDGGRGGKWRGEAGEGVGVRGARVQKTQPRLMRGVCPRARTRARPPSPSSAGHSRSPARLATPSPPPHLTSAQMLQTLADSQTRQLFL